MQVWGSAEPHTDQKHEEARNSSVLILTGEIMDLDEMKK